MKKPILILSLILSAFVLHAQDEEVLSRRAYFEKTLLETYKNGVDSVHTTIGLKNDTVKKAFFYPSGKMKSVVWKNDSTYSFDAQGRHYETDFGDNSDPYNKANYIKYYPNGQPLMYKSTRNKQRIVKNYDKNGRLLMSSVTKLMDSSQTMRIEDRNGVPILLERVDTFAKGTKPIGRSYDTSFYDNGQPCIIYSKGINEEFYGNKVFNRDGSLNYALPPDSLSLSIFKDNIDCYYGLKNNRGDTILQPIYEDIYKFSDFWGAAYGDRFILFKLDGSKMKTSIKNLSFICQLQTEFPEQSFSEGIDNVDVERRRYQTELEPHYYTFQEGEKYGVMNAKAEVIMPPQYLQPFYFNSKDSNFMVVESKNDSFLRTNYLNRQGKLLFLEKYKSAFYTKYEDYYYLTIDPYIATTPEYLGNPPTNKTRQLATWYFQNAPFNIIGLGKGDGSVLIEPKFTVIRHFMYSPLFITGYMLNKGENYDDWRNGIYNVSTKKWLLDTLDYRIQNRINEKPQYFVVKHVPSQKWGIMDTTGKYIVPISLDLIESVDNKAGVFSVKIEKNFHILTIDKGRAQLHTAKYDTLAILEFNEQIEFLDEPFHYFFAKQKGLWGLIDLAGKLILPFEYDYVSRSVGYANDFFMVKNKQVSFFDIYSMPNQLPNDHNFIDSHSSKTPQAYYQLVNQENHVFFYNDSGQVRIPPQYKLVKEGVVQDYAFVEDDNKNRKLLFLATGQAIDFPFPYEIVKADAKSRVIVVKDSTETSYGVVSTDGKILIPCNNYNVAIGDAEMSVFFVKQDTPLIKHIYGNGIAYPNYLAPDTLNIEDNNWQMYDGYGRLLSDKPFRFPINFKNGIGIGMIGEAYNLYKADGSIVLPFQKNLNQKAQNTEGGKKHTTNRVKNEGGYRKILRDPKLGYYFLVFNQGLTATTVLTKPDGEILVESGRYDGISNFYDKYAVVTAVGKVGLIDSFGREIIAPQDLRTYKEQFVDSLDLWNKRVRQTVENYKKDFNINWISQPFYFGTQQQNHPDSLKISDAQRKTYWNLLLDISKNNITSLSNFVKIPRVASRANTSFITYSRSGDRVFTSFPFLTTISDTIYALGFSNGGTESLIQNSTFYNFYRQNKRWEDLLLNDLLYIQGEKRVQLNDIFIAKIRALKDAQIDCSNTSAFVAQVENKWQLTKTGIDFYFDSAANINLVVTISFTWAELSPFLKMKIH